MTVCPTPVGLLDGMSPAQLQAALTTAQAAYVALLTGSKGESFSYAQGDGTKSVTYTRATVSGLVQLITQLQAALGKGRARRPIRFAYR